MSVGSSRMFEDRSERFELVCAKCSRVAEIPSVQNVHCSCSSVYDIRYFDASDAVSGLPLANSETVVDLGQGDTPLIELDGLSRSMGLASLAAKLEFCSPTGSFKDRGSAVLVSAALEEGIREFVEDSSGNAGASMAAYAARAGMQAHIFAPSSAAKGKLDQIKVFGAELHLIDGLRQDVTDAAMEFSTQERMPYLSHAVSPWFAEGVKAMAWEIDASGFGATDIVAPAGNGALLIGSFAGYADKKRPRVHCVQSEAVQPLIRAIEGNESGSSNARPTVASGISVSMPPRVSQAARAVVASGGSGVAVSDAAILCWRDRLATEMGVFCEVTSAAAFAGLEKLVRRGEIGSGERVVVVVTGSGLKEPLS